MKKRLFAGLLSLAMLMTVGHATRAKEPFTFRDGIAFGMTMDEVIAIEGEPSEQFERLNKQYALLVMYLAKPSASGETENITYYFNGAGEMIACAVVFGDASDAEAAYDQFEKSLTQEYGKPSGDGMKAFLKTITFLENVAPKSEEERTMRETIEGQFEKATKRTRSNGTIVHLYAPTMNEVFYYDASYMTAQAGK